MKKYFIFILFFLSFFIFADDTRIQMGIGTIEYFNTEDPFITLANEQISIILEDDYIHYKIDFEFNNSGNETTYDIGFPVYFDSGYDKSSLYEDNIPLNGFSTTVNGSSVSFEKKVEKTSNGIVAWYIKKVTFAHNSITNVSIEYDSKYGRTGGMPISIYWANYFYGSANTWKGVIKEFKITITNNSNKYINSFDNKLTNSNVPSISVKGDNSTEIIYTNIKPDKDSQFSFGLINKKFIGGLLDDSSADTKNLQLSRIGIIFYTSEQLRLLRNLFYAMNGYIFKDAELTSFFNNSLKYYKKYKPQYNNVDNKLNNIEKRSIEVIQQIEKERQR